MYQAIARATDAETQLGRTVQVASQRESDLLAQIADVAPAAVPLVDDLVADHEKVVHGFRVTLASKDSALASQGELVVSLRGELGNTQELHELTKGRLEFANSRVDYLEGRRFRIRPALIVGLGRRFTAVTRATVLRSGGQATATAASIRSWRWGSGRPGKQRFKRARPAPAQRLSG